MHNRLLHITMSIYYRWIAYRSAFPLGTFLIRDDLLLQYMECQFSSKATGHMYVRIWNVLSIISGIYNDEY